MPEEKKREERWRILKDGVPVAVVAGSIEEAEKVYLEHDADELRRIEDNDD